MSQDNSRDIHAALTLSPDTAKQLESAPPHHKQADAKSGDTKHVLHQDTSCAPTLLALPPCYSGDDDPPPEALNFFHFFGSLFTQDEEERHAALIQVMQALRAAVLIHKSEQGDSDDVAGKDSEPAQENNDEQDAENDAEDEEADEDEVGTEPSAEKDAEDSKQTDELDVDQILRELTLAHRQAVECHGFDLVEAHLPTIVRFSVACPFDEIQQEAEQFLTFCKAHDVKVPSVPAHLAGRGPSYFFPSHMAPPANGKTATLSQPNSPTSSAPGSPPLVSSPTMSQTIGRSPASFSVPDQFSPNESAPDPSGADFYTRGRLSLQQIFQDSFLQVGRLSHLRRIMGWHPTYLAAFNDTMSFVMRGNGPLPDHWRHYVAIMASSRYGCEYLILQQSEEFLAVGGKRSWLRGIEFAPPKLQALVQLNSFLAHQPWRISKELIRTLFDEFGWNSADLVHAMVIMCTFHALSSLSYGLGVTPETDVQVAMGAASVVAAASGSVSTNGSEPGMAAADESKEADDEEEKGSEQDTERLLRLLSQASADQTSSAAASTASTTDKSGISDTDSTIDQFAKAGPQLDDTTDASACRRGLRQHFRLPDFTGGSDLVYEDFDVRSSVYKVFRTNEYNWKEHGLQLVNMSYKGAGDLLNSQFDHIFHLTYKTFNEKKNVDTRPFRRGLWYYVQRLYGVCYDDYNYEEVNKVLNRTIKQYVKKVSCHPERLELSDFNQCGLKLRLDEKCHIALLSVEAHKLASLLYGLHGIMEHTTKC